MELDPATFDKIVKALCNTLLHSLWQGLILALITGITVVLTRRSGAALRYNLFISYLVLFSAAIAFTFFTQLPFNSSRAVQTVQTIKGKSSQAVIENVQAIAPPQSLITSGLNYLNAHSYTVVFIWFLIICARCVKLVTGLHDIYHIRRTRVFLAGAYWDNLTVGLSAKLGIARRVRLMQSGIARVPMMIGYFKPIILVPLGMLAALSAEEVESILLHELAHIKRGDYVVNLLQNLVEIVFFFNPAILWISALIKAERENCCDDMVLSLTGSKTSYIRALVACQEYGMAAPPYAMALGGSRSGFLQRVKRIVENKNQSLNKIEKVVLSICLVTAILLTAGFSKGIAQRSSFTTKRANNRQLNKGLGKPVFVSPSAKAEVIKSTPLIGLRKAPAAKIPAENIELAHAGDTAKTSTDTIRKAKQDITNATPKPAYRLIRPRR